MGSGEELDSSSKKGWFGSQAATESSPPERGAISENLLARMIAERMPGLGLRAEVNDCRVAARLLKLSLLVGTAPPVRKEIQLRTACSRPAATIPSDRPGTC